MATSGTYTLSKTLNQLLVDSFDIMQIIGDGETLSGDMFDRGRSALNLMLKDWEATGLMPWLVTEGTLFLDVGKAKYDFQLSTTKAANQYYETSTTAPTVATASTIDVTAASNIQALDVIGIIQNNSNLFWTTVTSVSSLEITLADGIPLPTLSGAVVYSYRPDAATAPSLLPISRITPGDSSVRRKEGSDYEIPIIFESRGDYFSLPNKNQIGTPIQAYYDRQDLAGESSGVMYLWSAPASSAPVINFTYDRKIQIMVNDTDTLDAPDYAQKAVIYGLAIELMPRYGVSPAQAQLINSIFREAYSKMVARNGEMHSIRVTMGGQR